MTVPWVSHYYYSVATTPATAAAAAAAIAAAAAKVFNTLICPIINISTLCHYRPALEDLRLEFHLAVQNVFFFLNTCVMTNPGSLYSVIMFI